MGSQSSRSTLVTEGFELRERNIQVYADYPFSTDIGNPNENVLKVTVKGDPCQFVTLKSTLFYFFIIYTRIVHIKRTFILWGTSFKTSIYPFLCLNALDHRTASSCKQKERGSPERRTYMYSRLWSYTICRIL